MAKIIVIKNKIRKAIDKNIINLPRLIVALVDNLCPITPAIKKANPPIAKISIKYCIPLAEPKFIVKAENRIPKANPSANKYKLYIITIVVFLTLSIFLQIKNDMKDETIIKITLTQYIQVMFCPNQLP